MMTILALRARIAWSVLVPASLLGGCAALPHGGGGTLWTILAVVLFVGVFLAVIGRVRRRHTIALVRRGTPGGRHDTADAGSSSYLFAILAADGSTSHATFVSTSDGDSSGWESRSGSDAGCTDTGSSYSDSGSSCSSDSGSSSGSDSGGGGGGGGGD
jgi:hypothetical protein